MNKISNKTVCTLDEISKKNECCHRVSQGVSITANEFLQGIEAFFKSSFLLSSKRYGATGEYSHMEKIGGDKPKIQGANVGKK